MPAANHSKRIHVLAKVAATRGGCFPAIPASRALTEIRKPVRRQRKSRGSAYEKPPTTRAHTTEPAYINNATEARISEPNESQCLHVGGCNLPGTPAARDHPTTSAASGTPTVQARVTASLLGGESSITEACSTNRCSIRVSARCSRCTRFSYPYKTQSPHVPLRAARRSNPSRRQTAHAPRRPR
jgi:hypothetical protein